MPILNYEIADSEEEIDDQYIRTSSRVYQVIATEDMEAYQVRSAFPYGISSAHPTDPGQFAHKIACKLETKKKGTYPEPVLGNVAVLKWSITVNYGPLNPLQRPVDDNPLNQPIRWRMEPVTVERPIEKDVDGNPVVNTAGDPFDPGPVEQATEYLLTILRNEKDVDLNALMLISSRSRVNDDVWNRFPEKTVKSLPIKIPEQLWYQGHTDSYPGDGFLYYPMEYQFHINFETWKLRLLNQGYGKLVTSGGMTRREQITDAAGAFVQTPVMLDMAGSPLAQPIDHSNIVTLEFDVCEAIDFNIFNLDGIQGLSYTFP